MRVSGASMLQHNVTGPALRRAMTLSMSPSATPATSRAPSAADASVAVQLRCARQTGAASVGASQACGSLKRSPASAGEAKASNSAGNAINRMEPPKCDSNIP